MDFATKTIHAGQPSEPQTGAVVSPIFQTTTYQQIGPGEHRGFDYTRTSNPTRKRLEAVLAELEGATHAAVFGSGLAAEHAILQAYLKPGGEIVVPSDVYGGTFRMLHRVFEPIGCRVTTVDFGDLAALERAVTAETTIVWLESPTNPRLLVYDIDAISRIAHARGALVVVDNTFATPVFPAAVPARRRSGRAQRDEIPGGALRSGAGRRHRARPGHLRARRFSPECAGRRAQPVRLLAHACADSRRWSCGCSGTPKTPPRSPTRWRRTRVSHASTSPVCRPIRVTTSPGGR